MKSLAQAERLLGRRLSKPELVLFISYRHHADYLMADTRGNLMMQHRIAGLPQIMAKLLYQPFNLLQAYATRKTSV
jgi:hypothetical protein